MHPIKTRLLKQNLKQRKKTKFHALNEEKETNNQSENV